MALDKDIKTTDEQHKKAPVYYDLSEVEKFLAQYEKWYNDRQEAIDGGEGDSGSNPGGDPPPPPPHNP